MLWYEYNNKSVALSTRIRLARNIDGVPFPSRLSLSELKKTNRLIADSVKSADIGIHLREIDMDSLGELEAYAMVERHCISPKFAANREGRILLLSDDESVSIMIGEEDHLRIQVLKSGECLKEAYGICERIETAVGQKLKFAFSEKLGFLTECPTNLGTGLRASVMLHLPVLEGLGDLRRIAELTTKLGLTFRGFYGEGSESKSGIYQLSNQVTLGVSEQSALENLENIANEIIKRENDALKRMDRSALEDSVCRTFGILKYARRLNTDEMMAYITKLMLGLRADAICLPDTVSPMKLFIELQPAMIKRLKGDITPNERDIFRAESIRNTFKNIEL